MGLFDLVKEKAAELLGGASEKVSELTGTDLPGTDQVAEHTENLTGTVEEATGTATDAAGNLTETATGAVEGFTDPRGRE